MKHKKLIASIIALLLIVSIALFFVMKTRNDNRIDVNVYESLQEDGYQGTINQLLISLTEETVVDDSSAYEQAVSIGYRGSYKDWIVLFLNNASANITNSAETSQKSSYDYALENGFSGTEEQWFGCFSAKDKTKSAYEICVDYEFSGNRIDWINAISATNKEGKSVYDLSKSRAFADSKNEWLASLLEESNDYCGKIESTYSVIEACGYDITLTEWIKLILGDTEIDDKSVLIYSAVVEENYKGSYSNWIKSLVTADNKEKSVYDELKSKGYKGTKQDLEKAVKSSSSLDEVYEKLKDDGYEGTKEELIELISQDKTINEKNDVEDKDAPTITISSKKAKKGEKNVNIIVSVKNNPGILGMVLKLEYDENALVLRSASNGKAVSDVLTLTKPKTFTSGCNFGWDGVSISENEIKDGDVLVLSFDIRDSAKRGSYPIKVSFQKGNVVDKKLKSIPLKTINGVVEVEKKGECNNEKC